MAQGKKDEAMALKEKVTSQAAELDELSKRQDELTEKVTKIMMLIPNIIDPSVPIGKDDSFNVEVERFGDAVVPDYEVPYHTDIMESFGGAGFEDLSDIFDSMFGGGGFSGFSGFGQRSQRSQPRGPVKGENRYMQMSIDFLDSIHGVEKLINISVDKKCKSCNGCYSWRK